MTTKLKQNFFMNIQVLRIFQTLTIVSINLSIELLLFSNVLYF